jgi:NADH dehydrogenase/NADH:ubiquinone oxidoreductase subunit G
MVRCIHCTRCIRFLKDKALTNDLGTIGRGEKTEISFYFNKFLDKSLLSGNIVDICPVGALTNKDYSFKGRPWEMDEIKYIGISDTLGLGMRVAVKRSMNKILRITPIFSNDTGTKLISDFTRHCVDGILLDRIESESFKSNNVQRNMMDFKVSSQLSKLNILESSKFKFINLFDNNFSAIIGSYTSLKDLLYLSFKNSEKGSIFWSHASFLRKQINTIYPFLYSSNLQLPNFIKLSSKEPNVSYGKNNYSLKDLRHQYISIGTDFLSEFPSLSSKILSGFSGYILARDAFCLGLLPYKKKNVFFNLKKGLGTCSLIDILEGRSKLCKNISKNLKSNCPKKII